jgi:tetratricopeptide (TPR) repeat protein
LWPYHEQTEAYQRVSELLSFKPDHRDGLLLKGHLMGELWETDSAYIPGAIAFFKDRLLDNSDDMLARSELYWIYNSEGYENEARLILEESVLLDDVPPQLLYRYAMMLETDQKPYEAIHYLEFAFEHWKAHHIVHHLGRLKEKVDDYESAIYYYRLALNEVSDPIPILHSIANCYHFLGNYLECVRVTCSTIVIAPDDITPWENLMYSLEELQKREPFYIFIGHLRRLRNGKALSKEKLKETVDNLLQVVSNEFGSDFADTLSIETWLLKYPTSPTHNQ